MATAGRNTLLIIRKLAAERRDARCDNRETRQEIVKCTHRFGGHKVKRVTGRSDNQVKAGALATGHAARGTETALWKRDARLRSPSRAPAGVGLAAGERGQGGGKLQRCSPRDAARVTRPERWSRCALRAQFAAAFFGRLPSIRLGLPPPRARPPHPPCATHCAVHPHNTGGVCEWVASRPPRF